MTTSLPLFLISLSLIDISAADPNLNLLGRSCRYTKAHAHYCLSTLSSEPNATKAADVHDIAVVSLELALRNATATSAFVSAQHNKVGKPELDDYLTECADEYVDAVEQLYDAKAALHGRDYKAVENLVSMALAGVKACQEECHESEYYLMTKRNSDVSTLCSITLTLTRLLH